MLDALPSRENGAFPEYQERSQRCQGAPHPISSTRTGGIFLASGVHRQLGGLGKARAVAALGNALDGTLCDWGTKYLLIQPHYGFNALVSEVQVE